MPARKEAAAAERDTAPAQIPILMIGKGRVFLPGPSGPVPANGPDGSPLDVLDVADRLAAQYRRVYVVDLDGLRDDKAQLDYLQELSRDLELWVDAGIRTGDQAIDILVAGASRAVLSTAFLEGPRELQRAWKLSQELTFEIEVRANGVSAVDPSWSAMDPQGLAASVRAVGVSEIILSPRERPVDWDLVRALAKDGPVWVDGTFGASEAASLQRSGAQGGFVHLFSFLGVPSE